MFLCLAAQPHEKCGLENRLDGVADPPEHGERPDSKTPRQVGPGGPQQAQPRVQEDAAFERFGLEPLPLHGEAALRRASTKGRDLLPCRAAQAS